MYRKLFICLRFSSISLASWGQTLSSAVQHALISNPNILRSIAENHSSEQGMKQALGAYLPSVNIGLGIGREKTQNPVTNSIGGASSNQALTRQEASIELRQRIFDGFSTTGEFERKKHLWHAQEYRTLGLASDISLQVTEKYFEVLKQQQLLILSRNNLADHQQVFDMIQQRAESGISGQSELAQASGRLALANANIISVRNNLRDARTNFKALVGEAPKKLVWPSIPGKGILPPRLSVAIQKGLDNHPTLKSAYADIQEAKAQYKVAKATDLPDIDLILSASRNRNTDGLVGKNDDNLAMLRLSYNVFRGGTDLARKRETAYQVQEAYEVKNKTINQLKESVRLSWYAWLTAGKRLVYLREHVDYVSTAEKSYEEQFKIAKRSLLDLLDSKNETYEAKIEREKGIIDEAYTRFRILNSSGSLLDFLSGRLPLGVHNDDLSTSHENIQHLGLNRPIQSVPKVDLSQRALRSKDISDNPHKPITKQHLLKTTTNQLRFKNNTWYVSFKTPSSKDATTQIYRRLKKLGMKAFIYRTNIYIGPFEYRAQAGTVTKRLFNKAKIHSSVVYISPQNNSVARFSNAIEYRNNNKQYKQTLKKQSLNRTYVPKNMNVASIQTFGPTTKTDDLWQIALKYKEKNISMSQVMFGILKQNPHAFTANNINGLKTGVTLKIPNKSSFSKTPYKVAFAKISEQTKLWKNRKGIAAPKNITKTA